MEGGGTTERFIPAKKGGGSMYGAKHDGGKVAAGQNSTEAGGVAYVGKSQRGGARAAAGLETVPRSYQSRRWRRQRGSDDEQLRPAAAERRQIGRTVGWRGVLGEGQQREARAAGELGGDAWSGAEAVAGLGRHGNSSGWWCCRAAEEAEEEEEQGGRQG
jgi:hypothetical protein